MTLRLLLVFTLISFWVTSSYSQESEPNPFSIKWENGFKVDSKDKNFKLKFGGRIHLDHAYFSQDDDLDESFGAMESNNGTEFRRARLFFSGTLYKSVGFKFQIDFAGGVTRFKDVYIEVKKIPVIGTLRVGHFKEPQRFEALTSSKYIPFMERAITADLAHERNNGIMIFNDIIKRKLSFQTGVFRNADGTGNDRQASNDIAVTSRISTLAIDNLEKEQLLHFGFSYSYRKPDVEDYSISVRPRSHLAQKYISTGIIPDVETVHVTNFESAYSYGPFTVQAEYLNSSVKQNDIDFSETYNFNNYYGQISYFITGEHRPYKNSYETFGRVKPINNFMDGDKGIGAWELALRYTHTDLNSKNISGGEQSDISFGTNWYLNPVTRIMFNYVWTDLNQKDGVVGNLNIFEVRFQIDF